MQITKTPLTTQTTKPALTSQMLLDIFSALVEWRNNENNLRLNYPDQLVLLSNLLIAVSNPYPGFTTHPPFYPSIHPVSYFFARKRNDWQFTV